MKKLIILIGLLTTTLSSTHASWLMEAGEYKEYQGVYIEDSSCGYGDDHHALQFSDETKICLGYVLPQIKEEKNLRLNGEYSLAGFELNGTFYIDEYLD